MANKLRGEIYDSVMKSEDFFGRGNGFLGISGGQITINEDRLKSALEENPDKVADFFAGIEGGKGTGLFYRINDAMTSFVNVSQVRTLQSLENSILRTNEQMQKMTEKMYKEEDKLYRMFAAMETAMSKLQQQGDWFSSMLGGGQ